MEAVGNKINIAITRSVITTPAAGGAH